MYEVKVKVMKREIKTGIVSSRCSLQHSTTKYTIFVLRYLYCNIVLLHVSVHGEALPGKKCPIILQKKTRLFCIRN